MTSGFSFRPLVTPFSMGMEWEALFQQRLPYGYNKFFQITDDASIERTYSDRNLREYYSRECVSQPLPPEWLKKEIKRFVKGIGPRYTNESCGVHIHVNRKVFSKKKLKAIFTFLQSLTADQYVDAFGRWSTTYAGKHTAPWPGNVDSKYKALNLSYKETIEFRMFASKPQAEWLCYCVDCVVYLIKNAHHLNMDAFFAFVDANKPQNLPDEVVEKVDHHRATEVASTEF